MNLIIAFWRKKRNINILISCDFTLISEMIRDRKTTDDHTHLRTEEKWYALEKPPVSKGSAQWTGKWYLLPLFPTACKYWLKEWSRASLVVQWLRICLPMQRTQVRALVWEGPTCRGSTGPVSHNYWACASGACAPQQERPRRWEAHAPQLEEALAQKRRPNTDKNK